MPRIPTSLLLKAYQENHLLPLLLKECRSLQSARNELRWLRERALRDVHDHSGQGTGPRLGWRTRLRSMCHQRARGVPLQYILGDQPFGDLEILCQRGVLIPRSDTESYTYEASRLVRQIAQEKDRHSPLSAPSRTRPRPLRILDLCTGTGCIALLLHSLLAPHFKRLQIMGVDISPIALNLARRNLAHNIALDALGGRAREEIRFYRGDVLRSDIASPSIGSNDAGGDAFPSVEELLSRYTTQADPESGLDSVCDDPLEGSTLPKIDLLISNPPYISHSDFHNGTTARSVRLFEPRLALVPPTNTNTNTNANANANANNNFYSKTKAIGQEGDKPEDIFYRRLLRLSQNVRASLTVLECGDRMQADRVVEMVRRMRPTLGAAADDDDGGNGGGVTAEVWPDTEEDCLAHGFHVKDGSRCVVIRRGG